MSNDEKMIHNKAIATTKYYTMEEAMKAPIISTSAFIIANERTNKNGGIGRYYTVFPHFRDFLHNRDRFPHCHEMLVDHCDAEPNIGGRLVFDFDLPNGLLIPPDFKSQIEDTVYGVIDSYFHDIEENKLEFVWSSSENPNKFSKHLTVKNLYFNDWLKLSDIFYKLFNIEWDKNYEWISSEKLIDVQIVRLHASLRMVGSSKIGGYPLKLDDNRFDLTDALIRIYQNRQREVEQTVSTKNLNECVMENVLNVKNEMFTETSDGNEDNEMSSIRIGSSTKSIEPVYEEEIYHKAYELFNIVCPRIFKMGKIKNNKLLLMRRKAAKCLLSGRVHESQNAYLIINTEETNHYIVRFGCYQKCSDKKRVLIGYINQQTYNMAFGPTFKSLNETLKAKGMYRQIKSKTTKSKSSINPLSNDKKLKEIAQTLVFNI